MTVSYAPGPTLPPGTPAHTRWGWVNALVPVAYLVLTAVQLPVVTLMMRDYFRQLSTIIAAQRADPYASSAMRGLMSTVMPMMLTSVALSVLSLGLGALFVVAANRDHETLGRLGYPRRFHWAWSFFGFVHPFGILVYPIGRAVVVHRQAAAGWGPMWLAIAAAAASFTISVGWSIWLMFAFFQEISALRGTIA